MHIPLCLMCPILLANARDSLQPREDSFPGTRIPRFSRYEDIPSNFGAYTGESSIPSQGYLPPVSKNPFLEEDLPLIHEKAQIIPSFDPRHNDLSFMDLEREEPFRFQNTGNRQSSFHNDHSDTQFSRSESSHAKVDVFEKPSNLDIGTLIRGQFFISQKDPRKYVIHKDGSRTVQRRF